MSDFETVAHARSLQELLVFVREFRASLTARESALIAPCDRPGPLGPQHIRDAAVQLARVRALDVVAMPHEEIDRIFAFYTQAAARLARLEFDRGRAPTGARPTAAA